MWTVLYLPFLSLSSTAQLPHKNIAKLFPHSGSLLFTKQEEGAHWPLGSCCVLQHLFLGQLLLYTWAVGDKDDEDSVVEQRGAAVLLEVDMTDIVGR